MRRIKYTKEQVELITGHGKIIMLSTGHKYYRLPFWFKETEEEYVFEQVSIDDMPDESTEFFDRYMAVTLDRHAIIVNNSTYSVELKMVGEKRIGVMITERQHCEWRNGELIIVDN